MADDTHVTKLVGAPGSGKTTKLLEFVAAEAEQEVGLNDMTFMTFTKAARNEVSYRLAEVFPDADEEEREAAARTLHSAALGGCLAEGLFNLRDRDDLEAPGQLLIRESYRGDSDDPDDLGDAAYFNWFFKKHFPSLEYDVETGDVIQELESGQVGEIAEGNQLMALYNYVCSRAWPVEEHHRAPIDVELPQSQITEVLQEWDAFKEKHDLMQDVDYVREAALNAVDPPSPVLFIDEFQDLSRLQHFLYEQWRDHDDVERVYIAGDRHQAIYDFRGAEPSAFVETPADEVVHHEESFRCPEQVIDAAVPVAEPVPEHDVSGVTAAEPGGWVEHIDAPDSTALARVVHEAVDTRGEVYLLARTNRQAAKIAWGLRGAGIPYLDVKEDGDLWRWGRPLPTLLAALRSFDAGDGVSTRDAEILLRNATDAAPRREAKARADETGSFEIADDVRGDHIPFETLQKWFPQADNGRRIINELDVETWRADLLRGALESGAENDPEDVRVGTIHSAKGLEAPVVLLFPCYTRRQLQRFHNGEEAEERRLFYVGMTRASEGVAVVHEYHGGEEFPPLARA